MSAPSLPPIDMTTSSLILMEFIEGIEMGVGAYFNGDEFLSPPASTGSINGFFRAILANSQAKWELSSPIAAPRVSSIALWPRCVPATAERVLRLHQPQHHRERKGIWPLEFTCRFGYPGYAILDPLQRTPWADLFRSMLDRNATRFETEPGFSVGIVITTPPFPYCREQVAEPIGLPVLFDDDVSPADRRNLHYGEVGLSGGLLVTSGASGYTLVVTGTGETVAVAQAAANALAGRILVPNARYRLDRSRVPTMGLWQAPPLRTEPIWQ